MKKYVAWLRLRPRLVAFVAFGMLGTATATNVAWTDDARFYVPAAAAYAEWMQNAVVGVATLDFAPLSRQRIDAAFRNNHEHPPVAKYIMGIGWLLFHHWTGWLDEVDACRAGVMLLWAWMCALVFGLVRQHRGPSAGIFAGLALALMPRVLFHAHAETLDMPVTALLVMTFDAVLRCMETPRYRTAIAGTVFFGLALGAKLNAPFFLAALLVYLIIERPPRLEGVSLRLPSLPIVVVGMICISPLTAWLLWPWMWFDTVARLQQYVQFHSQHYGIFFYFRGVLYGEHVAPWYAPWLLMLMTVPLPVMLFALAGAWPPMRTLIGRLPGSARLGERLDASRVAKHVNASSLGLVTSDALRDDPAVRLALLAVLQAAVQLTAVSLPGVPVYGGIKLFLPAFPFLAILAGLAFGSLVAEIQSTSLPERTRRAIVAGTAVLLLLPGAIGVVAYSGTWLSYYNAWAGGVRGATAAGHERQYYDLAYPALLEALNEALPNGGGVAVLPNPKEYAPYLSRWQESGALSRGIRRATPENADILVLTHERRWRRYPVLMARYRTRPLLTQHTVAGVPMFSVYDLREGVSPPP
ncbi:MAG: glycosyltransferase family 39 protein [Myxococcota bacterium]